MRKRFWPLAVWALLSTSAVVGCGSQIGDACTTQKDCPGGSCINDLYAPGGYCSKGCDPAQVTPCPDGSVCVRAAASGNTGGTGAGAPRSYSTCLQSCDQPADCRDGYECRVVEGSARAVCIGLGI